MNAFIASIRLDALSLRQFALITIALVMAQGVLWIGAPLLLEGSIRQDVAEGVVDGRNGVYLIPSTRRYRLG